MIFIKPISVFLTYSLLFKCYAKKASIRIVGGQDATPEQLQSIVRIVIEIIDISVDICTGSVLSSTWVLTAAHCCDDDFEYKIRYESAFGLHGINDSYSDGVAVIIHPSYKLIHNRLQIFENDIALLKTTPIKLDRFTKLSAVDYTALFGQETVAAGHGITKDSHGNVFASTLALNKTLQVVRLLAHKCSLDKKLLSVQPGICLSPRCGDRSALCGGDSGGPLLYSSRIVGVLIISSQIRCKPYVKENAEDVDFGVATPVSPYIQWIRNTIK